MQQFIYVVLCCLPAILAPVPVKSETPQSRTGHAVESLSFVENKGQVRDDKGAARPDILFTAQTSGVSVFARAHGLSYVFSSGEGTGDATQSGRGTSSGMFRLDWELANANPYPKVSGKYPTATRYNYFGMAGAGNVLAARSFEQLRYRNVYPGIDLLIHGRTRSLKYDFIVMPGAEPERIAMRYSGGERPEVQADGSLRVRTPMGDILELAPVAFQGDISRRVPCAFRVRDDGTVGFALGPYDDQRPLVIDPQVLWRTIRGGSDNEFGRGIDTDPQGNVYFTGFTNSPDFPATVGQTSYRGNTDGYIIKVNPAGSRVWAGFIGGSDADRPMDIDVNNRGDLAITGSTLSDDFPATVGQTVKRNQEDAFVAVFSSNGIMSWAGFLGGGRRDFGLDVKIESSGSVLVTGSTNSTDFPASTGQTALAGSYDAFLTKFSATGKRLWSTYWGGESDDQGYGLDVEPGGTVVICGQTNSTGFPATLGQTTLAGSHDAFIARFSAAGANFWSTYCGGSTLDGGQDIALNPDGSMIVSGFSDSEDFPATVGKRCPSSADAFLVKYSSSGQRVWGTYFGGSSSEPNGATIGFKYGPGVAIDNAGNILIGGATGSSDLPALVEQVEIGGDEDLFVAKFCSEGEIYWSSFCGGSEKERGFGVAVDGSQNIYLAGWTQSPDFPATLGRRTLSGARDAVLVKYWANDSCGAAVNIVPDGPLEFCHGENVTLEALFYECYDVGSYTWIEKRSGRLESRSQSITVMESGIYAVSIPGPCGCDISAEVEVIVHDAPTVRIEGQPKYCTGSEGVRLSTTVQSSAGSVEYSWSPARYLNDSTVANPLASPPVDTRFNLKVTDKNGCTAETFVIVEVLESPDVSLTPALTLCPGDTLQMDAVSATPGVRYRWSPATGLSDFSIAQPKVFASRSRTYTLSVTAPNGCVTVDSVQVQVNTARLSAAAPVLDFGELSACESFLDGSIEISNTGGGDLNIRRFIIDNPAFTILAPASTPFRLQDGRSTTVRVRFTPAVTGPVNGSMRIITEPCGEELTIDLRGEKLTLLLTSPASQIDFGSALACSSEVRDTTLEVRNRGEMPVLLEQVNVPAPFIIDDALLPVSLEPGESITLDVRFVPDGIGLYAEDALVRFSAEECSGSLALQLKGVGDSSLAAARLPLIRFPELLGCDAVRDTSIWIANTGSVGLTYSTVESSPGFELLQAPPAQIPPGDSVQIRVRFAPTDQGTVNGTITLRFEPCDTEALVRVEGSKNGVAFAIPDTLDFGRLALCRADSIPRALLNIANNSGQGVDGRIDSALVTGPFAVSIDPEENLPNGDTRAFPVELRVNEDGPVSGTLDLYLQPCGTVKRVVLRALRERVVLADESLDFGMVALGQTPVDIVRFINSGTASAVVKSLNGLDPPFSISAVSSTLPATLGPGEFLDVSISFAAAAGLFNDVLELEGEIPCSFAAQALISGEGNTEEPGLLKVGSLDFGDVILNLSASGSLDLENTGDAEVIIVGASWQRNDENAFMLLPGQLATPLILSPAEKAALDISFNPQTPGLKQGRLVLELQSGASASGNVRGNGIEGVNARSEIMIPLLETESRQRGFALPLILAAEDNLAQAGARHFRAEVRVNATMFNPQGAVDAILNSAIAGQMLTMTVERMLAMPPQAGDTLVHIIGDVLLGNEGESVLELFSFEWLDVAVPAFRQNGLLRLTDICERGDGHRLLDYRNGFGIALVHPNPAEGPVLVRMLMVERALTSLELISMAGTRLWRREWMPPRSLQPGQSAISEVRLPDNLPAGVYQLVLRSPARMDARRLVILR